jgi:hypothetical protein
VCGSGVAYVANAHICLARSNHVVTSVSPTGHLNHVMASRLLQGAAALYREQVVAGQLALGKSAGPLDGLAGAG